jgi:hypothetical protein
MKTNKQLAQEFDAPEWATHVGVLNKGEVGNPVESAIKNGDDYYVDESLYASWADTLFEWFAVSELTEKPVMEYCVATSDSLHALVKTVNKFIGEGWLPQGGIVFADGQHVQAMVQGGDTD